ncbi:DUF4386 domain-containing protein [Cellulomonas sp. NS3]|uniref:DUF4386 domain-containing protein n=1 Tax=Cellulomonas sp. NS3 TaxID=2973977 RepID=UPI00216361E6|nr:DUF4386 domain-containing protein [Cellulomonas sp. NS3]
MPTTEPATHAAPPAPASAAPAAAPATPAAASPTPAAPAPASDPAAALAPAAAAPPSSALRHPQPVARLAALLYLLLAVLGAFAHLGARAAVHVPGDAAGTADRVRAHASLVRVAFVADLVQATILLFVGVLLYALLGHAARAVGRVMVGLVGVATAIMCLNLVHHLGALLVATEPAYAAAFGPSGADGVVLRLLDLHRNGYLVAQVFFGLWLAPLGWLVLRSRMVPRVIGVLLVVGCAGYLVDLLVGFLAPAAASAVTPFATVPAAVAELSLIGWLLVRGVRVQGRPAGARPR